MVLAMMIFGFHNNKEFLDQLNNCEILGSHSDNYEEFSLRIW